MSGDQPYRVEYLESVIKKDIPALTSNIKTQLQRAIETKLMQDPIAFGKPLRFGLYGQRALRVGDYRILYTVDYEHRMVTINAIGHRREIYES